MTSGTPGGTSKIFTIFALYSGFLSNISIANDKLNSFEFLVLSNTQKDYRIHTILKAFEKILSLVTNYSKIK